MGLGSLVPAAEKLTRTLPQPLQWHDLRYAGQVRSSDPDA